MVSLSPFSPMARLFPFAPSASPSFRHVLSSVQPFPAAAPFIPPPVGRVSFRRPDSEVAGLTTRSSEQRLAAELFLALHVLRRQPPSLSLSPLDPVDMTYAIKAEVGNLEAETFAFDAQKTMYGGRRIAPGDTIFVFASENEGGPGLVASGVIISAVAVAKQSGVARQTPRVSIAVRRTGRAQRRLGRSELKPFTQWGDGRPETELNFKFYRQATNKIVGISEEAAAFLRRSF